MTMFGGFWSSDEQMSQELSKLSSSKQQMRALKTQLKVRKTILNQKEDKELFQFSADKKILTCEQLKDNLSTLMSATTPAVSEDRIQLQRILQDPSCLQYKFIRQRWEDMDGCTKWWDGYIHHLVSGDILEFKLEYFDTDNDVFMEYDELVADIKTGDLVVLWDHSV